MNSSDFTCVEAMKDHLDEKPKDIIHVGTYKGSKVDIRRSEQGYRYVLRLGIVSNWVSSFELPKLISYINEYMPEMEFADESVSEGPQEIVGPSPAFLHETLRSFYEGKMGYVNVTEHVCMRPMKGSEDRYEMLFWKPDETVDRFEGSFSECLVRAENIAKTPLRWVKPKPRSW